MDDSVTRTREPLQHVLDSVYRLYRKQRAANIEQCPQGWYQTKLSWKLNHPNLHNNKNVAMFMSERPDTMWFHWIKDCETLKIEVHD